MIKRLGAAAVVATFLVVGSAPAASAIDWRGIDWRGVEKTSVQKAIDWR